MARSRIESVPHGLLFWRSQTHLLGGMGFLTLTLLFLPHGVGSMRIFRAESSPGQAITREKFKARNKDTMLWLWGIYIFLNLAQTALLCAGGMSLFDALCHAFGTVSTSGYSTKNLSVGFYNSAYIDWVTIFFMFCGGVTFILFYHLAMRNWGVIFENTELRWYLFFMMFFCLSTAVVLYANGTYSFIDALRYGSFQVVSILTTTALRLFSGGLHPHHHRLYHHQL